MSKKHDFNLLGLFMVFSAISYLFSDMKGKNKNEMQERNNLKASTTKSLENTIMNDCNAYISTYTENKDGFNFKVFSSNNPISTLTDRFNKLNPNNKVFTYVVPVKKGSVDDNFDLSTSNKIKSPLSVLISHTTLYSVREKLYKDWNNLDSNRETSSFVYIPDLEVVYDEYGNKLTERKKFNLLVIEVAENDVDYDSDDFTKTINLYLGLILDTITKLNIKDFILYPYPYPAFKKKRYKSNEIISEATKSLEMLLRDGMLKDKFNNVIFIYDYLAKHEEDYIRLLSSYITK